MKRRDLLKHVFIVGAATLVLPAYLTSCTSQPRFALSRLKLTRDQELLLTELTDVVIPKTDTPGAKELGVHVFFTKMIDDCFSDEEIMIFEKGMASFELYTLNGKTFISSDKEGKEAFFNSSIVNDLKIKKFLETIKYQVVRGYTCSEYVMTKIIPYQLVPGPFKGVVKVN